MDKTPKTTSKSQLIVFSPEVLKKLGIASQLSKLTTTSDNQEKKLLSQSLSNAIKLNTNDDNKLQLKLALNSSNANQIKPNETNTNLLLNVDQVEKNAARQTPESKQKLITNNAPKPKSSDETNEPPSISIKMETASKENEVLDRRVAEILTPAKRGRPKGKIKRLPQQFLATNVVSEEAEPEAEVEVDIEENRRRSGRQRKEKKLDDVVYYTNEIIPEKKNRRRSQRKVENIFVENIVPETNTIINSADIEIVPEVSTNDSETEDEPIISTSKRGRRRRYNRIESDDDLETIEKLTTKPAKPTKKGKNRDTKLIECGVCNEKMVNSLWAYHCTKHNYLCWRVGEDPIDLDNRKACESALLKVVATKKVTFTCANCGEKRKSVVGYLSHLDVCQKTEEERLAMRVMCPECNRLMQPCSLKIHMRNHLNESTKPSTIDDAFSLENEPEADLNGGRIKRNAAKKAQGLINQFTNDDDADGIQSFEKDITRLYKRGSDQKKIFSSRRYMNIFRSKFKKKGSMACPINQCTFTAFDFKEAKDHIETCPQLSPNEYICFACFLITQNKAHIEKHILQAHLMNQETQLDEEADLDVASSQSDEEDQMDDDYDDEELDKQKPKRIGLEGVFNKPKVGSCADKVRFLSNEVRISASRNCTYPAAGKWSQEFCKNNYSSTLLFTDFIIPDNWQQVPDADYSAYLPPTNKSLSVKTVLASNTIPELQGQEHDDWTEYELFEADYNQHTDTMTLFCGGPVWGVAWLPTPVNSIVDQIVAVSIQRDFNETYKTSQSYASRQIIEFWNFGKLHFKLGGNKLEKAKLEFLLAHDHGNVWCMEWCPSGCYEEQEEQKDDVKLRRMGLLALACSDGCIPIYSIYFSQIDTDKHKMFKPIECCKLIMQDDNETSKLGNWNYQCTKLKWSKIKGHNIITAGYSNGMVCLWDLSNNTSPLLKSIDDNGTVILKPYFSFQPHTAAITALHFYYPLTDDTIRWLFTGSWDRNCCLWDLQEPSTPIFVFNKRGNVSDGALINHWLCSFLSYDDVHFLEHTTTSIQNVRDFGFKNSSLLSANSMVMGLSASDWANAIAQVTLAGELCCTFQRQLLVGYDVDKGTKSKRFLLSYCETIDKHLDSTKRKEKQERKNKQKQAAANANIPENYDKNFFRYLVSKENDPFDDEDEPDTYEQVSNKYGLIFCDIPLDNPDRIPPETLKIVRTSSNMKDAPTEMYPIQAQNRVSWNPNKQAYIYICSGYHSGFVRVRCVRFMHSKLLTHIK